MYTPVWGFTILAFFTIYGIANVLTRIRSTSYFSMRSNVNYILLTVGLHVAIGSFALLASLVFIAFSLGSLATAAVLIIFTAPPAGVLIGTKIEKLARESVRSSMSEQGYITDSFSPETNHEESDSSLIESDTPSMLVRVAYRIGEPIITNSYLRAGGHFAIGVAVASPLGIGRALDIPVVLAIWVISASALGSLTTVPESDTGLGDRPDPPTDAQNVVVCMVDDVRRDRMSVYGHERSTTPFLERTEDESLRFDCCVSAGLRSGHSIPSLLTGTFSSVHQYGANTDLRMISDEFKDHGYTTGAISGNPHLNRSRYGDRFDWYLYLHHGKDFLFRAQRAMAQAVDWIGIQRLPLHYFRADIEFINELSKSFIRDHEGEDERPFFLYLNYIDVHDPYVRSDAAVASFAADHNVDIGSPSWIGNLQLTDNLKRWGYDETIRYTDEHIADLYSFLDNRDLLDNTIVLITSDHGEMLGERDIWGHIDIPYNYLFEVPLIAYTPSSSGESIDQVVSGAQFPSLLLELAGVEPSEEIRSQWLSDLAIDDSGSFDIEYDTPYALIDFYEPAIDLKSYAENSTITDQRMLIAEDWKCYQNDGERTFYKYNDIFMDDPVSKKCVPEDVKVEMRTEIERLNRELYEQSLVDDDVDPYSDINDHYLRQQLEDLGYM